MAGAGETGHEDKAIRDWMQVKSTSISRLPFRSMGRLIPFQLRSGDPAIVSDRHEFINNDIIMNHRDAFTSILNQSRLCPTRRTTQWLDKRGSSLTTMKDLCSALVSSLCVDFALFMRSTGPSCTFELIEDGIKLNNIYIVV